MTTDPWCSSPKGTIEFWVGDLDFDDEQEPLLAVQLAHDLSERGVNGSFHMNFRVPAAYKSRQIDLFVRTDSGAAVIEIKSWRTGHITSAERNGPWTIDRGGKGRKSYTNPVSQVDKQAKALSDAMADMRPLPGTKKYYKYFDELVAFEPWPKCSPQVDIEPGMSFDHATLLDYTGLRDRLRDQETNFPWSEDEWQEFFAKLTPMAVSASTLLDRDASYEEQDERQGESRETESRAIWISEPHNQAPQTGSVPPAPTLTQQQAAWHPPGWHPPRTQATPPVVRNPSRASGRQRVAAASLVLIMVLWAATLLVGRGLEARDNAPASPPTAEQPTPKVDSDYTDPRFADGVGTSIDDLRSARNGD